MGKLPSYLVYSKKNPQAALSLNDDLEDAVYKLEDVAESLKYDDNPDIAAMGYHRIHLEKHNYFMMYRVVKNTVFVDRIFRDLQDYKRKL